MSARIVHFVPTSELLIVTVHFFRLSVLSVKCVLF